METISKEEFINRYGQETHSKFEQKPVAGQHVRQFGIGAAKGLGESVYGFGNILTEGGRYIQAAIDPTRTVKDYQEAAKDTVFGPETQKKVFSALEAKGPSQMAGKVVEFGAELLLPTRYLTAPFRVRKPVGVTTKSTGVVDDVTGKVSNVAERAMESDIVSVAVQTGKELAERVPRFIGKAQEGLEEAGERVTRLRQADEPTKFAIKSGLPDKYINTIEAADEPTLKAYREMVEIAGKEADKIGVKVRPESVAGNAVGDQYKLFTQGKRGVGEAIGEYADNLSKKGSVSVLDQQRTMRNVLFDNGVKPDVSGKLQFTGKFTPAERKRMQELYDLSTEAGENMTARQVYDMDQLFSKLQRESRFDGVGDILVDTPQGKMSLFRVFRDIYSNKLDEFGSEIKDLNRQYRNYATLQDDLEKSIIKSGNFEVTKGMDDAEFAAINLKRIFGEGAYTPAYRQIYDELDTVSRELGYTGARADDLEAFALEIRDIYDATPRGGLEGGISASIGGMVDKVMDVGAPTVEDQQKALQQLIDSKLPNVTGKINPTNAAAMATAAVPTEEGEINANNVLASLGIAAVGAATRMGPKEARKVVNRLEKERARLVKARPTTERAIVENKNRLGNVDSAIKFISRYL